MHKRIRIILEYGCYPVWLYDDDGGVIATRLPDELCDDIELDAKFRSLQARYKALFINNEQEFSFVGFQSESEYEKFCSDWNNTVSEFIAKLNGKYILRLDIRFDKV